MNKNRRSILDAAVREIRRTLQQQVDRTKIIGETNTKRVLITPLLEALNWNTRDLDEMQNEFRAKSQDNPVDYALFLHRSPCLFLEAKSLGVPLDDRKWIGQTIGYASIAGVDWCVLTNGDEYRLYNAHASVDAERKLFRSVTISDAASHDFIMDTLELISKDRMQDKLIDTLWKSHFVDQRVKVALEDLFQGDDSFIRLIAKREKSLTQGEIRQSLQRADFRVTFPALVERAKAEVVSPVIASRDLSIPYSAAADKSPDAGGRVTLKAIIDAGLVAAPFRLEVTFKKQNNEATVEVDGTITYQGNVYNSPSHACSAIRDGKACNGWVFWQFQDTNGELKPLDALRQVFVARQRENAPSS